MPSYIILYKEHLIWQSVIYTTSLFGITTNIIWYKGWVKCKPLYETNVFILSQRIQILRRNTCSKFTNEDSKYFLSNLLCYIENKTIFLPGCYSVIPDVPSSLKYIIFQKNTINLSSRWKFTECQKYGVVIEWCYPRKLCACCRKTRHKCVNRQKAPIMRNFVSKWSFV
jgi:hypothetical protein